MAAFTAKSSVLLSRGDHGFPLAFTSQVKGQVQHRVWAVLVSHLLYRWGTGTLPEAGGKEEGKRPSLGEAVYPDPGLLLHPYPHASQGGETSGPEEAFGRVFRNLLSNGKAGFLFPSALAGVAQC